MLEFVKIKRTLPDNKISDVEAETRRQLLDLGEGVVRPGERIAVLAGSRGINNIALIIRAVVGYVKEMGAEPFIVPAMGSHGGATAEGQKALLAGYGVTEEFCGAPVVSSMDVIELPESGMQARVFVDKNAFSADGIIDVNRVKPHTDFHGPHESGIMKMLVIGLGKHKQALEMHNWGTYGLRELIPIAARRVIATGKIRAAVGIVENMLDHTAEIRACLGADIEALDLELIEHARRLMPALPVKNAHILIVDEIGKDISGTGMDTNITGRMLLEGEPETGDIKINRIIVNAVSEGSHGNAIGMGFADFAPRSFLDMVDFESTNANVVTSTFLLRGKMPILGDNMRQCIEWAERTAGSPPPADIRAIRIKNTLRMDEMYVTRNIYEEIKDDPGVELIAENVPAVDEKGDLTAF